MTPERLQEIRAWSERGRVSLNAGDAVEELLDYIDLLHEDLRITRQERDAEKHKCLVLRKGQAAAWDEGRERGYFDRAADEYHGESTTILNPYLKDTE